MVRRIAAKAAAGGARPLKPKPILHDADASVTHVEVCGCHGVGRLVEMLFDGEPNILSVRFSNLYGGRQEFGSLNLCVAHEDKSRNTVRDSGGDAHLAQ